MFICFIQTMILLFFADPTATALGRLDSPLTRLPPSVPPRRPSFPPDMGDDEPLMRKMRKVS